MKAKSHLVALLCFSAFSSAIASSPKPPEQKYFLKINENRVAISSDAPVVIKGDFKDPKVALEKSPTLTFDYAGLRFDYPNHMSWEVDEKTGKNFTLSGNDFKILVFDMPIRPKDFMPGFLTAVKAGKDISQASLTLNGITLKGVSHQGKIADSKIKIAAYTVETKKGPVLLVLQDFTEDKSQSKEATGILEIIGKTFTVTR